MLFTEIFVLFLSVPVPFTSAVLSQMVELVTDIKVACFQNSLKPYVSQHLRFMVSDPRGMEHVQWVSFCVWVC